MMAPFDRALEQLAHFEGGFSNNPLDRGGRTFRGITQKAYDAWRKRRHLPSQPVDLVTDEEHDLFYLEEYWQTAGCDQLPELLAIAVFDMAVNSGAWNAKLTLQEALRVRGDGVIGPVTIAAAKAEPDAVLLFLKRRGHFIQGDIRNHPGDVEFLGGWINRLLEQAWTHP